MAFDEVTTLRRRASACRQLAGIVDHTPAMQLERWAGIDTWRGPRAADHLHLLRVGQQRLRDAADDLRRQARQLERLADDLEAARRSGSAR